MELFVDYGASYFPSREEIYGPIPGIKDVREWEEKCKV